MSVNIPWNARGDLVKSHLDQDRRKSEICQQPTHLDKPFTFFLYFSRLHENYVSHMPKKGENTIRYLILWRRGIRFPWQFFYSEDFKRFKIKKPKIVFLLRRFHVFFNDLDVSLKLTTFEKNRWTCAKNWQKYQI